MEVNNPQTPYITALRIFPGSMVKISCRPTPNATRFAINFQTGPSFNPRDDLALHLSPCFTGGPPRIIRNSLQDQKWQIEEAWGNGTPISPHEQFEFIILAEHEQFKIAINGAHYCEFRYRIPYHEITHLTIDGDVSIHKINISSNQQPTYPPSNTGMAYSSGPVYPSLAPYQAGPYPTPMPAPGGYPSSMPTHGGYPSSMPAPGGYPAPMPAQGGYPSAPGGYMPGVHGNAPGPMPTPASYMSGGPSTATGPMPYPSGQQYPQQQPHQQPGHSSSPFGNLPIGGKALGTIAGLGAAGLGAAALLSAANPLKMVKKATKKHKMFKHKRGSSSSNSSISSRSSFSSNSS